MSHKPTLRCYAASLVSARLRIGKVEIEPFGRSRSPAGCSSSLAGVQAPKAVQGDNGTEILSPANKQYAWVRTPDRQQAKGFAAASLLLYSANAMRSDEDSLRCLTGITKFIYFHPHKKSTRRIPVLYTTTLYHYTSSFTAFHFRLGKIPYIFINIHIIFDVSKQRNLIAP